MRLKRFDGERLTMAYDVEDRVTGQTDSQGRRVTMRCAGTGRHVEHTDPMGHRVRLRYDSEEDLVAAENEAGDLYTFELDLAGRVKRESSFAGHRRLYAYDNAGRVDRVASGFHRATKLMRDPLGRVIESVSRGGDTRILGGAQPEIETYQYDELGDLIRASTPGADTVFERDVLGRVLREQQRVHASEREVTVASRYDKSGLRVERSTSLLHEAKYDHNNAGDLVGVSADWTIGDRGIFKGLGLPQASAGPFEIRFARDALGQELARRLPGGVSAVWTRDAFGRPVEQRVVTGARSDRPGTDVMRKGYAWQSPDQIASIRELNPATGLATRGSSYECDTRGHLIRQIFSSGEVLERQSDAVGNLYRSADRSDRVYGKGGVLQRANGTEYTFDADGFLSEKTLSDGAKWAYSWNAQGQLREVTRPDKKKVVFAYDAFGRRVRKEFEGKVTEYVWDGDDLVHERVSEAGKELPLVTWLFEPGTCAPVAKIEGRKRFGIVSDHLGVPSAVMTKAGRLAWRAQLDVYGVPREESAVAEEADRTANPWRFPGQYEDPETGLYYNRFRYYDPAIGRYISEDPIGLLGGVPLLSYVKDPAGWLAPVGSTGCGDAADITADEIRAINRGVWRHYRANRVRRHHNRKYGISRGHSREIRNSYSGHRRQTHVRRREQANGAGSSRAPAWKRCRSISDSQCHRSRCGWRAASGGRHCLCPLTTAHSVRTWRNRRPPPMRNCASILVVMRCRHRIRKESKWMNSCGEECENGDSIPATIPKPGKAARTSWPH